MSDIGEVLRRAFRGIRRESLQRQRRYPVEVEVGTVEMEADPGEVEKRPESDRGDPTGNEGVGRRRR